MSYSRFIDELLPEVIATLSNPDVEPINVRQGIRSINSAMAHVYELAEELGDFGGEPE
jgi:hypothetical protein